MPFTVIPVCAYTTVPAGRLANCPFPWSALNVTVTASLEVGNGGSNVTMACEKPKDQPKEKSKIKRESDFFIIISNFT